ncbi:hypothetical protein B0G66_1161, partial [Bacillus badius]
IEDLTKTPYGVKQQTMAWYCRLLTHIIQF